MRLHKLELSNIHISCRTIQCYVVAFFYDSRVHFEVAILVIDIKFFATDDAALAPASRYNCRMARLAASSGQNALRRMHATDIFRACLFAYQYDFLALRVPFVGSGCIEHDSTGRRTRDGVDALYEEAVLEDRGIRLIYHWVENTFDIRRLNAHDSLFFSNQLFLYHVDRNSERSDWASLAGPALQHVEFTFLNGKLKILHVLVMTFELCTYITKLLVGLRVTFGKFRKLDRCANACHDVFALCINKVVAIEDVLAGVGVSRKANTST